MANPIVIPNKSVVADLTPAFEFLEGWLFGTATEDETQDLRLQTLEGANALVSALPGTPFDGQEIYYVATPGVNWHFRYNAGSASAYKWEYLGGPSLFYPGVMGQETIVSPATAYSTAATVVGITVPLGGDYEVTNGATMFYSSGGPGAATNYCSVKYSAAAAVDADAFYTSCSALNQYPIYGGARTLRVNGVPGGGFQIQQQYRTNGVGVNLTVQSRTMSVKPIRVG